MMTLFTEEISSILFREKDFGFLHKPLFSIQSFKKHFLRPTGFNFPAHAVESSGMLSLFEQNTPLIWCPEPHVLEHLLHEPTWNDNSKR